MPTPRRPEDVAHIGSGKRTGPPRPGISTRGFISRRRLLTGAGAALLGGASLEGLVLEPRRIDVTRHRIGDASTGAAPIRLVQLTDLHLGEIGRFHERIAEEVEALRPDVVLITGDSVDEERGIERLATFLALMPNGAERFATLGNWEYWSRVDLSALRSTYERSGCRLLVNEAARVERGQTVGYVIGLDDLLAGNPDLDDAARDAGGSTGSVLISHCPAWRDTASIPEGLGIDVVLSGHTHGGQVAIGRWAPVRPPGSGRYVAGWYRGDGPDLYVSRGLGTSIVPVRLGSVPEIAMFEWFPGVS